MMDGEYSSSHGIEVIGQAPEAYPGAEHLQDPEEKETVAIDDIHAQLDHKQVVLPEAGIVSHPKDLPSGISGQKAPNKSRHARLGKILDIVVVMMIIAIVVPVGVIVSRKNSDHANPRASASTPAMSSAAPLTPIGMPYGKPAGVLNGTRLSTMDPRTGGDIYLFYQHSDGSLRYISQNPQRTWRGSTTLDITDALPGTPLAAVSTSSYGSVFWWLFYVDNSNVIQNIYTKSDPTLWYKGTVGLNRYRVPNQTNIAFTASRGIAFNSSSNDLDGGLSLYASSIDGNIHEYIFNDKDGSWTGGFIFRNTDIFSGATTYSIAKNAYFFALSKYQTIEIWWRNYDPSLSNNDNTWHLGPSSHGSVAGNVSICAQFLMAFQGSSGMIQGSNFTASADPGAERWGIESNISSKPAISGSAVSCWYFYDRAYEPEGLMFQVFYQVEGNRIDEARKHWGPDNATLAVGWTYGVVPT